MSSSSNYVGVPPVQPLPVQGEIPDQMWFLMFVSHASRLAGLVVGLRSATEGGVRAEIDSINTAFRNWLAVNRDRLQPTGEQLNMGTALFKMFTAVKNSVALSASTNELGGEEFLKQYAGTWYQPNASKEELVQTLTRGRSPYKFFIRKSSSTPGSFNIFYQKGDNPTAFDALITPLKDSAGWKTLGSDGKTYELASLSILLQFIDRGLVIDELRQQEKRRPIEIVNKILSSIVDKTFGDGKETADIFAAFFDVYHYVSEMIVASQSAEAKELLRFMQETLFGLVRCAAYALSGEATSSANQYTLVLASAIKVARRLEEWGSKKANRN